MNNSENNDPQLPDNDSSTVYESEVSITVGEVAVCIRGPRDPDTLLDLCFKAMERLDIEASQRQCPVDRSVG